jgi:hypothetical protein
MGLTNIKSNFVGKMKIKDEASIIMTSFFGMESLDK